MQLRREEEKRRCLPDFLDPSHCLLILWVSHPLTGVFIMKKFIVQRAEKSQTEDGEGERRNFSKLGIDPDIFFNTEG